MKLLASTFSNAGLKAIPALSFEPWGSKKLGKSWSTDFFASLETNSFEKLVYFAQRKFNRDF